MNGCTDSQQTALRETLLSAKADIERRMKLHEAYGLADSAAEQTGELSAYDNHPADLGSEQFERGKDIALNEHEEHRLADINEALERLENGTYGVCRACGRSIPFERLEALPTAQTCIAHAPEKHLSERRPVEEQLLQPPFGRTSLEEPNETFGFDGEDAWQIVESWGNSDSPAMSENRDVGDYGEMSIEAEEQDGFVEPIESFLATDLYGRHVTVVRNGHYRAYMENNEGEPLLEPDPEPEL